MPGERKENSMKDQKQNRNNKYNNNTTTSSRSNNTGNNNNISNNNNNISQQQQKLINEIELNKKLQENLLKNKKLKKLNIIRQQTYIQKCDGMYFF